MNRKAVFTILVAAILLLCSCELKPGFQMNLEATETQSVTDETAESSEAAETLDKPSSTDPTVENTSAFKNDDDVQKTLLSIDELAYFTTMFNRFYNSGFLMCSYDKPSEIDLNVLLLYSGPKRMLKPDELADYRLETGKESAQNVIKMTSDDINDLLKDKSGIAISNINTVFNWIYLEKYDAYYTEYEPDYFNTAAERNELFYCDSGYKTDEGYYVINCIYNGIFDSCTVTLHSLYGTYKFVSNVISKDTDASAMPNIQGKTNLTSEELAWFTDYFWQRENNGFLLSRYDAPAEINLHELFYSGAGLNDWEISDEEESILREKYGFSFDIIKLTTAQIDSFLEGKMGIKRSDVTTGFYWDYLKEYDAYYYDVSDTNFCDIYCYDGYKTDDGIYVIDYVGPDHFADPKNRCTVTLHKTNEQYLFVSNAIQAPYVRAEFAYDISQYDDLNDRIEYFSYHLPAINIDTEDAAKINAKICSAYLDRMNEELELIHDGFSVFMYDISYRDYENGDIISLLIELNEDSDVNEYQPYNISKTSGMLISGSDLIAAKGLTETAFLDAAFAVIEEAYKEYNNRTDDDFYQEQYRKTLSPEIINTDMPMFLDDDGTINIVARIFSLAGADYYDHIIDTGL